MDPGDLTRGFDPGFDPLADQHITGDKSSYLLEGYFGYLIFILWPSLKMILDISTSGSLK